MEEITVALKDWSYYYLLITVLDFFINLGGITPNFLLKIS